MIVVYFIFMSNIKKMKKAQFIYDYLKVISLIDTCVLLSKINLYNLTCFFFFGRGNIICDLEERNIQPNKL